MNEKKYTLTLTLEEMEEIQKALNTQCVKYYKTADEHAYKKNATTLDSEKEFEQYMEDSYNKDALRASRLSSKVWNKIERIKMTSND